MIQKVPGEKRNESLFCAYFVVMIMMMVKNVLTDSIFLCPFSDLGGKPYK